MKKYYKETEFKSLTQTKLVKNDYALTLDVLHFGKVRGNPSKDSAYVPTLVEVNLEPKGNNRTSFTVTGSADRVGQRRFSKSSAKDTSSFPLKKRYMIKVPVNDNHTSQRITFRVEVYHNIFSKKGNYKEVVYHLDLSKDIEKKKTTCN